MRRLRLPFIFAATLLAIVWGAGDARVPAMTRRVRGQVGRLMASAGAPDALRADAAASLHPERRPDSCEPAALPPVPLAKPVHLVTRREQHQTASAGATPRMALPHAPRAPPLSG